MRCIGNKRSSYASALSDVLPKRYRKRLHGKLIARQTELGGIIDGAVAHQADMRMPGKLSLAAAVIPFGRSATILPMTAS
jgi:hypothetical protein